jgi:GNAT superfamily N-acetyltransferase
VALPERTLSSPGQAVWGLRDADGSLASVAGIVRVEDAVAVRSMTTAPELRGRGYGSRLLRAALADGARDGARLALLYSSYAGAPFYAAAGFSELERWQMWSRPRWVLGR